MNNFIRIEKTIINLDNITCFFYDSDGDQTRVFLVTGEDEYIGFAGDWSDSIASALSAKTIVRRENLREEK